MLQLQPLKTAELVPTLALFKHFHILTEVFPFFFFGSSAPVSALLFAQWPEVCFLNESQSTELTDKMSITEFIHKIKPKEEKAVTGYHTAQNRRFGRQRRPPSVG